MASELAAQQEEEHMHALQEGEGEGEGEGGRALQFGESSGVFKQAPYIEFENVSVSGGEIE